MDFVLRNIRMAFDLIADQRLTGDFDRFLKQRHGEIRHADLLDETGLLSLAMAPSVSDSGTRGFGQ